MSAASISQQTQPIAANAISSLIRAKSGKMRVVARPGSGATMRVFKSSSADPSLTADAAAGLLSYANFNPGIRSLHALGNNRRSGCRRDDEFPVGRSLLLGVSILL